MATRDTTITIPTRNLTWFAAGVAATLALTGLVVGLRASAASPAGQTTFVPMTPCRLVDTRPEPTVNVGPRNTPIGPNETHEQQVTGINGNCTIPPDASAVALNVTAVAPTAQSYMTLWPSDQPRPAAANLNYTAGAPPTPNKVDVKLSADGRIGVYNRFGSVHFIADVAGYYTDTGLRDLQEQIEVLDAELAGLQAQLKREHVWSASVASDGDKVGTGPFAVTRNATGDYTLTFEVNDRAVPFVDPAVTATSWCDGSTASAYLQGKTYALGGGFGSFIARVRISNSAGTPLNCGFSVIATLHDPAPRTLVAG